MYRYYCLFLVCISVIMNTACNNQHSGSPQPIGYSFPDDWLGHWSGDLNIYNKDGLNMELKVELELAPMSSDSLYPWSLRYISEERTDERNYYLKKGGQQENHWIVDENNSIYLDGYVLDNTFYVLFEVGNNRIQTSYRLSGDNLIFENLASRVEKVDSSGGLIIDSIPIPLVNSFLVTNLQTATLNRKEYK